MKAAIIMLTQQDLNQMGIGLSLSEITTLIKRVNAADPFFKDDGWFDLIKSKLDESAQNKLRAYRISLHPLEIDFKNPKTRMDAIRKEMAHDDLDHFIVLRRDEFNNEYVPARHERLSYATGFTGSAGAAMINKNGKAAIFSDSRYTLQVKAECPSDLFIYEDYSRDALKQWIVKHVKKGAKIGIDGQIASMNLAASLKEACDQVGATLVITNNTSPLERAWDGETGKHERPPMPLSPVIEYPLALAGRDIQAKRTEILDDMAQNHADCLIINDLTSIAWFLNIRGRDIACTPVTLGYLTLGKNGDTVFYIDQAKLTDDLKQYFNDHDVTVKEYDVFYADLKTLKNQAIQIDPNEGTIGIEDVLLQASNTLIKKKNPCHLPKAIKTRSEQQAVIKAHEVDAIALCKFLHWLDTQAQDGSKTELDAVAALESFRQEHPDYKGPSFDTISGAGSNGAIVHYRATKDTNKILEKDSVFLCDSGGQYLNGTTDVTRTIAIGNPGDIMPDAVTNFTHVLKGHIAVSQFTITPQTTGKEIDDAARASLKSVGLNYGHGTGHGVGVYLGVHEGPQGITPYWKGGYTAGMIVSNEPGYYEEDHYGIRIENLVLIEKDESNPENLKFRDLTLAPLDRRLIDVSLLNDAEITWINEYHARVYKAVAPNLPNDVEAWLKAQTMPLTKTSKVAPKAEKKPKAP